MSNCCFTGLISIIRGLVGVRELGFFDRVDFSGQNFHIFYFISRTKPRRPRVGPNPGYLEGGGSICLSRFSLAVIVLEILGPQAGTGPNVLFSPDFPGLRGQNRVKSGISARKASSTLIPIDIFTC